MNHFEDTREEAPISPRARQVILDDKTMHDVPLDDHHSETTNDRHNNKILSDAKDGLPQAFIQSEESKEEKTSADPSNLRTRASSLSFVIESAEPGGPKSTRESKIEADVFQPLRDHVDVIKRFTRTLKPRMECVSSFWQ